MPVRTAFTTQLVLLLVCASSSISCGAKRARHIVVEPTSCAAVEPLKKQLLDMGLRVTRVLAQRDCTLQCELPSTDTPSGRSLLPESASTAPASTEAVLARINKLQLAKRVGQEMIVVQATWKTCPDAGCSVRQYTLSNAPNELFTYGYQMVQASSNLLATAKVPKGHLTSDVIVCIMDSGVDFSHPELKGVRLRGPDCKQEGGPDDCIDVPNAPNFHGTACTGTMTARRNKQGIAGIADTGATFYSVNVFQAETAETTSVNVMFGLLQCEGYLDTVKLRRPRARMVINLSLSTMVGSGAPPTTWANQTTRLYKRGDVLMVAASGNTGDAELVFPAAFPEVISVSSIDCNYRLASTSTRNRHVELTASGVRVVSLQPVQPGLLSWLRILSQPEQYLPSEPFSYWSEVDNVDLTPLDNKISTLVNCGNGTKTCANARGGICVISRGAKVGVCRMVVNCIQGGGVAAIIINNAAPSCKPFLDTRLTGCTDFTDGGGLYVPTVGVTAREGAILLARMKAAGAVGLRAVVSTYFEDVYYTEVDGTSFAAPYVAGAAARLWQYFPRCSNAEVRRALQLTARDLGPKGRDIKYGFGLVQMERAYTHLQKRPCARP